MEKKYIETVWLRASDCDMKGAWRPGAILTAMQETAGVHSGLCGLPRPVMDEMGLAWVLSRLKVEFTRMPVFGEKVTVETYPTPNRHMFYPRSHVFLDENGGKIGVANSLWVIIDTQSRKIVNPQGIAEKLPDNKDLPMAAGMPATVRTLDAEVVGGEIVPAFTDMDMNMHVNNTKYLDWCCNALGIDIMAKKCIAAFDVNYDSEIRPGMQVRTELTRDGDKFAFCGFNEDKRLFAVGGRLTER